MCTYLFMYLVFYITWVTCYSLKGILSNFNGLLRRDPHFFFFVVCGYFQILNLDWECLEFSISCRCFRVFSGCSRPRPLCAFSHCLFFNLWNILLCNCLIYCMLLFVNVNHFAVLLKNVPTNWNPVFSFHSHILSSHSLHWPCVCNITW